MKGYKTITTIFILFSVILSIVIVVQFGFVLLFSQYQTEQHEQNLMLLENNISAQSEVIVNTTKSITETLSLSTTLRTFVFSTDYSEITAALDAVKISTETIIYANAYIQDIYFESTTGKSYSTNSEQDVLKIDDVTKAALLDALKHAEYVTCFLETDHSLVLARNIYSRKDEEHIYQIVGQIYFIIEFDEAFSTLFTNANLLFEEFTITLNDDYNHTYVATSTTSSTHALWNTSVFHDQITINIEYTNLLWESGGIYVVWIITNVTLLFSTILIMFLQFRDKVKRPIYALIHQIQSIDVLNSNEKITVAGGAEISYIADALNTLAANTRTATKEIISTQAKLYELEIESKENMFFALQSQINPHFLYNTLQCIRGISLQHNAPEIGQMCTGMAQIFRYSIKGRYDVTLEQELNVLKKYIMIMQIRFDNKYQVTIDVPPTLYQCKIPKLTLQPILENSFNYGIFSSLSDGYIHLKAALHQNTVSLYVIDNGKDTDIQKIQEINAKLRQSKQSNIRGKNNGSIGLINVTQRLHSMFGDEATLSIHRHCNMTFVRVTFPYQTLDCTEPRTPHNA